MRCCFLLFLAVPFLLSAKSANTVSQPTFLVKFDVLQKHFTGGMLRSKFQTYIIMYLKLIYHYAIMHCLVKCTLI